MTWKGCTRTRKWNESLPEVLVTYLLAQIRAASRASLESCSYSSDTRWQQNGKSSTEARLRPKSKIRIYVLQIRNRFVISRQGVATDLRVGDTTVVARFGVRLVLTVAVAASGTTTHLEILQSEAGQLLHPNFQRPIQRYNLAPSLPESQKSSRNL